METTQPPPGTRAAKVVVPLATDGAEPARLSFDSGLAHVELRSGTESGPLLAAQFSEPLPLTWCAGHNVHVEYPLGFRMRRRAGPNRIRLNPGVRWALDVHGGAAHLDADLTGIDLRSVACHGAAAHARFVLGRPTGPRTLRFAEVKHLVVERSTGVPVRLEIAKGAVNADLDGRFHGAVSGLAEQTAGYDTTVPGYRIVVAGGADTVIVAEVR